jgi:hypothetical protein
LSVILPFSAPALIGLSGISFLPPTAIAMLSSTEDLPALFRPPRTTTFPSGVMDTTDTRFTFSNCSCKISTALLPV